MKFLVGLIMRPINWILSFIFGIVAFILMIFVVLALTFNYWMPTVAPWLLKSDSGYKLSIDKSRSNVFTLNFNFDGVSIHNSDQFPVPDFIQIDRFSTDLMLLSLLRQTVVVENFVLDIPQVTYIKNADGTVNVTEFLSDILGEKKSPNESPKRAGKTAKPLQHVVFEKFYLRLGRVVMMDYTANPVKISEFKINYDIALQNIPADQLLKKITADLKSKGVGFLMQAVLSSLIRLPNLSDISSGIMKANGMAIDSIHGVSGAGKDFIGKVKSIFK